MFIKNVFPPAFIYLVTFLGFLNVHAQNSIFEWVHQAGGNSNERGFAIELDSFGHVFCTGEVSDSTWFADTSFVANFADIYLSKFSNDGNLQWIRLCGGTGLDRGLDMKVDANNDIIVTGFFSSSAIFGDTTLSSLGFGDVFIAKYNSQGDFLWVVHGAGNDRDRGLCLSTDTNNNIYVSGYFAGSLQLGSFSLSTGTISTMFIAKLSPAGTVLWAKQAIMQDFGESISYDLVCDSNGDVIVTGYFDNTATFQDTTLYSYDGSDDIFVAKYSTNGNKIWVYQIGGNYDDTGNAITIDEFNNLYLTGDFRHLATFGTFNLTSTDNNADLFFGKLDPSGNFQWVKHGSGAQTDSPNSIFYHQQYGVAICGGYSADFSIGDSTFNSGATEDIFLANFTSAGTFKYALSVGDNGEDSAHDVYLSNDNRAFLIGKFGDSILFGDSMLVSHNLADIFITKINLNQLSDVRKPFSDVHPNQFSLAQNYPNPFNPTTVISWQLAVRSPVTVTLYNLRGQRVAVLLNEFQAAGNHQVMLDGRELASGIYFYRLEAGKYVETKKMVLMR